MPTNETRPFFKPGQDVTGFLTEVIDAKLFVAPVAGGAGVLMEALRRLDAAGVTVLDVGLLATTFFTLFVIMDPPGTVPIFLALTSTSTANAIGP